MAKEKTVEQANITPALSPENIREMLDKASIGREELAGAVLAKIEEEHDETTKREMMSRCRKSQYKVASGYLSLRRQKDIERLCKKELVLVDRLNRYLMGYTVNDSNPKGTGYALFEHTKAAPKDELFGKEESVDAAKKTVSIKIGEEVKTFKEGEKVPPVIDYVDYDNLYRKIRDWKSTENEKIENAHSESLKKLDANFGEYWNSSWRYN